jgi:hypothetical protein
MASYTYDSCGTGWKRDFPEFGMASQCGDIALQRVVQLIRTEIALGKLSREDLDKKILLGIMYVATDPRGQHEVVSQDVLTHLAAQINALPECQARGWQVSWQDWRS